MPVATDLYYHLYPGAEEGKKPPVVLIHGAGGTHLYWPHEIRRLAGYRIFALDLPGHGRSAGRGHQTIQAYTQSVMDWLEAVGLHSAVFVGHSMGSAIALTLALDFPEHVLGLGLVGGGSRLRVAPALIESASSPTTFHSAVEMVVGASFGPSTPARLLEMAAQRMAETRHSVFYGDLCACDAFDETDRIAQIEQPAVILCGTEDRMTPQRYSQFLAANLKNSRLELIPGAGHMLMLEEPLKVAASMTRFLSDIPY